MTVNKNDYLILSAISALYVASILYYKTQPSLVLISTSVFAILYIIWGIFHQSRSHNLHLKIVLEYFLVALLGVVLVSTLLL